MTQVPSVKKLVSVPTLPGLPDDSALYQSSMDNFGLTEQQMAVDYNESIPQLNASFSVFNEEIAIFNATSELVRVTPRGNWVASTLYSYDERNVVLSNSVWYICNISHTSVNFSADLTAGRWRFFNEGGIANQQAAIAMEQATAATAAKVAAESARDTSTAQATAATAAKVAAESARDTSTAQATAATAAKVAAESARDSTLIGSGVYVDEPTGRAAVADGAAFKVQGAGLVAAFEYRRVNASSSTLIASYPSAAAVQKPIWTGKKTGWPDPYFRAFDLTSHLLFGRDRWWQNGGVLAGAPVGWALVNNPIFDGKALHRNDGYNQTTFSGPVIWLDEIGASAGDFVTAYVLITGASGTVFSAYQFMTDTEVNVGAAGSMVSATAATSIAVSGTPQFMRISIAVPAGATKLALYPYNASGAVGFDLVSCWAFKGGVTAGADWPDQQDPRLISFFTNSLSKNSLNEIEAAYVPYVVKQSSLGDAEMAGDADYLGSKTIGFYTQVTKQSLFNALSGRVWATDATANIEWKVWIRDTTAAFNMQSVAATVSGTVNAGSFPTSNAVYTLQLPSILTANANQYIFVMYRAANDTAVNSRRWLFNAGISPARNGFLFTVAAGGWNTNISFSDPAIGYGQVAIKALLQSEELRLFASLFSAESSALNNVEMVVPPIVYGVQGREANLYFDNLLMDNANSYFISVDSTASLGKQQEERWTWTPSGAVSAGSLTIGAIRKNTGLPIVTKSIEHRAAASTAGAALNKRVIIIGDSLVSAGITTQTLLDIAATDVMGITLQGTRGSALNKHEGRGGWTVDNYTTAGPTFHAFTVSGVTISPVIASVYTNNGGTFTVQEIALTGGAGTITCSFTGAAPAASGTLTKLSGAGGSTIAFSSSSAQPGNPFWIAGALNFTQYLTNNAIATPDWVLVGLGINDIFSSSSDASAVALSDAALVKMDTLIASIKAAGASVKVGLMIPTPCSESQDAFGENYGVGQSTWRFKRNILTWAKQMIAKYSAQEANRIYLVPSNTALDTVNNMMFATDAPVNSRSTITVARQNNGVHPATSGYQQISDAVWAFLKFYA